MNPILIPFFKKLRTNQAVEKADGSGIPRIISAQTVT
jgi:hypothetical protein